MKVHNDLTCIKHLQSPTFRSTLKPRKPCMAYMDSFNHSSLDLKIDKNQKVVLSQGF